MRNFYATLLLFLSCSLAIYAQNSIKGIVLDSASETPLAKVSVTVKETNNSILTNDSGSFLITNLKDGNYLIEIRLKGYETQNFPVTLNGKLVDLGTIYLYKDLKKEQDISIVNITDDELNSDDGFTDNIAGLLQSSRDVFFSAAAFDFSATFFRPRGLDNANGKVLIDRKLCSY